MSAYIDSPGSINYLLAKCAGVTAREIHPYYPSSDYHFIFAELQLAYFSAIDSASPTLYLGISVFSVKGCSDPVHLKRGPH